MVSCFNIITGNKPKLSCGVHSCWGHSPFHLRPAFLHQDSISGAMRGFEQASPSWFWGFSLLMETLGSLRSKPLGKRQHLLSHRAVHVLGVGVVLQETSPFSVFKEGPRGVRALNPHFRPVLPIWHQQGLIQVAGTCDICVPCRAQTRQRVGRLSRDGLRVDPWAPGREAFLSAGLLPS